MSIKQQVMTDMKDAMKAKDQLKLSTLRMLNSAIKNKEIEVRPNEISDQEVISVVKKLVKQRQEAMEQFRAGGRDEMADKEAAEAKVLEIYLPPQLSEEQITKIVEEVIAATGASSMKDMGGVMKQVNEKCEGAADGKLVSQIVKSKLQ